MIEDDNDNPYYDDAIMKYLSRPHIIEFENLTYFQYFERYSTTPSQPVTTSRLVHRDELQNYVVKRSKEIVVRYRFLKIEDGELYFYQRLLLNLPARSENDFRISPNGTYREKFLQLYPNFLTDMQNQVATTHQSRLSRLNSSFWKC